MIQFKKYLFVRVILELRHHECLKRPARNHCLTHQGYPIGPAYIWIELVKIDNNTTHYELWNNQHRDEDIYCYSRVKGRRNIESKHIGKAGA